MEPLRIERMDEIRRFWILAGFILLGTVTLQAQQILLPTGSGPFDVAVIPETSIAVTANRNSNSVSISRPEHRYCHGEFSCWVGSDQCRD